MTRDLFAGASEKTMVPLPRPVTITGGPHPRAELGWCSSCHEPASAGVTVRRADNTDGYIFICPPCVRRIAEVCP